MRVRQGSNNDFAFGSSLNLKRPIISLSAVRDCTSWNPEAFESSKTDLDFHRGYEPNAGSRVRIRKTLARPRPMAGEAAGPGEGPVEDGDRALGDEIVDPPAGGGRVAEEEDGRRPEVRVDEDIVEPSYGEDGVNLGESSGAAHGSHGSHGGTSAFEPAVPPADRQRPVPMTLDEGVGQRVDRDARENAYEAMERRSEDVSQVARSLAYMTSLVTTLVGRMDRVEQAQTSSGRRTATTSARMETPMVGTPEAGSLGWVDLRRLDAQLGRMSLEAGDQQLSMERPLATMDSIMAGTFSSDDSQTARRRLEQERGVPGSLLGPLAAPLAPVVLSIGAPGEAELEMARRSLQERAAEALAAERQRLSQEPPLVGSTPPPGLMQLPSIPQGSATAPMQLPSHTSGIRYSSDAVTKCTSGIHYSSNAVARRTSGIHYCFFTVARRTSGICSGFSTVARRTSGITHNLDAVAERTSGITHNLNAVAERTSGIHYGFGAATKHDSRCGECWDADFGWSSGGDRGVVG